MLALTLMVSAAVNANRFDCTANRHDYVRVEYTSPAENTNGRIVYECRLCGGRITRILYVTGWGEWEITREPTCAEPGLRTRTSLTNPNFSETEEIPATGHKFVETIIEPTCAEPGQQVHTCSVCGYSYTEEFGELNDCYYIETITREPSCGAEGIKALTCEVCGDYYTKSIPALEHAWGDWIIEIPAEPEIEGRKYIECALCGERIYEIIPALPAQWRLFGIIGPEEAVVTSANVGLWIILPILLFGEIMFIIVKRRKKRKILAQERTAYSGKDGYTWL